MIADPAFPPELCGASSESTLRVSGAMGSRSMQCRRAASGHWPRGRASRLMSLMPGVGGVVRPRGGRRPIPRSTSIPDQHIQGTHLYPVLLLPVLPDSGPEGARGPGPIRSGLAAVALRREEHREVVRICCKADCAAESNIQDPHDSAVLLDSGNSGIVSCNRSGRRRPPQRTGRRPDRTPRPRSPHQQMPLRPMAHPRLPSAPTHHPLGNSGAAPMDAASEQASSGEVSAQGQAGDDDEGSQGPEGQVPQGGGRQGAHEGR